MQKSEELRANSIRSTDLKEELKKLFNSDWRFCPPKAGRSASEMIHILQERSWLLTVCGPEIFGLVHRTFLEYPCALEFVDRFRAQELNINYLVKRYVQPKFNDDSWHEIIRLLVGQLPPAAAEQCIKTICRGPRQASYRGRQLGLAWQCLSEISPSLLPSLASTCDLLMDALYAWFSGGSGDTTGSTAIVDGLSGLVPRSWPSETLAVRGMPNLQSDFYPVTSVLAALCQSIWAYEPGAGKRLLELAVKARSEHLRRVARLALANSSIEVSQVIITLGRADWRNDLEVYIGLLLLTV